MAVYILTFYVRIILRTTDDGCLRMLLAMVSEQTLHKQCDGRPCAVNFNPRIESAIDYRPPSIIGRARALMLAVANKTIIATDRWVNVG